MAPDGWERVGSEGVSEHGIFRLRSFRARSPRTGEARPFTVVDTADWVNVIAVTEAGRFLLVRQFRHGIGKVTLEIPGGIVNAGEDPAAAAARELREETGWGGDPPERLGVVDTNPAIFSNRCSTYLVRNCRRLGPAAPDPGEDLETVTLDAREVRRQLANGSITHALVLCAFTWYRERAPRGVPSLDGSADDRDG
jgi:ADP-ribose diphosphatase